MNNNIAEMTLVGFYHFSSKDKTNIYYVAQVLFNDLDKERVNNKANILNIFVSDDEYKTISQKNIGETLNVSITPNISTGKIYYKVVL